MTTEPRPPTPLFPGRLATVQSVDAHNSAITREQAADRMRNRDVRDAVQRLRESREAGPVVCALMLVSVSMQAQTLGLTAPSYRANFQTGVER